MSDDAKKDRLIIETDKNAVSALDYCKIVLHALDYGVVLERKHILTIINKLEFPKE